MSVALAVSQWELTVLKLPFFIKAMKREWRNGDLTLLFIALVVAVSCVSAVNNFTVMVKEQLAQSAVNMLGADAVLTSKSPINPEWVQESQTIGLKQTMSLSFSSMAGYQNQLQLVQVKAVSSPYPLSGVLKIANTLADLSGIEQNKEVYTTSSKLKAEMSLIKQAEELEQSIKSINLSQKERLKLYDTTKWDYLYLK